MDKASFYRAFIGPQNTDYYLARFKGFDEQGGKAGMGWNWSAFLFSSFWLLWRRLWVPGAIVGAFTVLSMVGVWLVLSKAIHAVTSGNGAELLVLLTVLGATANSDAGLQWTGLLQLLGLAFTLVPPMWGNAWYYRLCQRNVDAVCRQQHNDEKRLMALTRNGGTTWIGPVLLVLALVAALVLSSAL